MKKEHLTIIDIIIIITIVMSVTVLLSCGINYLNGFEFKIL